MARRIFETPNCRVIVTMEPTDRWDSAGRDIYNVNVTVDGLAVWPSPQELAAHISSKGIATDSKRGFDLVAASVLSFASNDVEYEVNYQRRHQRQSDEEQHQVSKWVKKGAVDLGALEYAQLDADDRIGS